MASIYEHELQDLILEAEDAIRNWQKDNEPYYWQGMGCSVDDMLIEAEQLLSSGQTDKAIVKLLIAKYLTRNEEPVIKSKFKQNDVVYILARKKDGSDVVLRGTVQKVLEYEGEVDYEVMVKNKFNMRTTWHPDEYNTFETEEEALKHKGNYDRLSMDFTGSQSSDDF